MLYAKCKSMVKAVFGSSGQVQGLRPFLLRGLNSDQSEFFAISLPAACREPMDYGNKNRKIFEYCRFMPHALAPGWLIKLRQP